MYQKKLHILLDTCQLLENYTKTVEITPKTKETEAVTKTTNEIRVVKQLYAKDVPEIVTKAKHMIYWVTFLKWSVYLLIWS